MLRTLGDQLREVAAAHVRQVVLRLAWHEKPSASKPSSGPTSNEGRSGRQATITVGPGYRPPDAVHIRHLPGS